MGQATERLLNCRCVALFYGGALLSRFNKMKMLRIKVA